MEINEKADYNFINSSTKFQVMTALAKKLFELGKLNDDNILWFSCSEEPGIQPIIDNYYLNKNLNKENTEELGKGLVA